MIVEN